MIESAALLFREQGYSGTGFNAVIEHSGAPRGSIYHHFPGGKAELAAETVRYAGDVVATHLARIVGEGDPVAALHVYLDWWVRTLERSDFRAGCPVVAVAVEAQDDARRSMRQRRHSSAGRPCSPRRSERPACPAPARPGWRR